MIKRFLLIIFAVLIVLLLAKQLYSPQQAKNNPQQAYTVIDYSGAQVALVKPAKRVIALAPHIAENVFSAGAGDTLVGVMQHSDYPEVVKQLPIIGSYNKLNNEKIIQLNPDLIIAWQSGNSQNSIEQLKKLGFKVYLDQPHTVEDVAKSIRDIGILTGHKKQAQTATDSYLQKIQQLSARYSQQQSLSVFYQVWNKPLQTINGKHIISDAIKVCGGDNIYADESAIAPVINLESILDRDPQVIIASGISEERADWLDEWQQWDKLTAVKHNNQYLVHPDHIQRHTLRILLGIDTICQQLEQARDKL